MFKKAERFFESYPWVTAVGVTAILFFGFNIITTPLFNSGDDTFLMYTLAGGYGEQPTNLLHYNHIWHPWLGWVIKNLFLSFPGINWYTIVLLFFHLCGCSAVFYVLLKKLTAGTAFLFFSILFFFFETRLMLSLTFTGAAFVGSIGALTLLQYQLAQKKWKSRNAFFAICLLILAGMLRLQIVWLALFLFIPLFITKSGRKQFIHWITISLFVVVLLFGLNKIHQQYYVNNIPGWKQQESFRQAIFYAYNRPIKQSDLMAAFTDSSEYRLFFAAFFYDSSRFSLERVKTISQKITRQRWLNEKEDRQGLYWFFIEMRIYILLFALMITALALKKKYGILRRWILSFLAVAAVYGYLFVFMKITTPIHLGLLLTLWIHLTGEFTKENIFFSGNRRYTALTGILFILLFFWMAKRITVENSINKQRRHNFLCSINEIERDPQKLFVATDDSFPLSFFYIWDVPARYPLVNLLYKDRLITHTWVQTLKRFGISDLNQAMLQNEKVFLLGPPLPALDAISPGKLSDKIPGYQCLEVRKLIRPE